MIAEPGSMLRRTASPSGAFRSGLQVHLIAAHLPQSIERRLGDLLSFMKLKAILFRFLLVLMLRPSCAP